MRRLISMGGALVLVLALGAPAAAQPTRVYLCHFPRHDASGPGWYGGEPYAEDPSGFASICEDYGGRVLLINLSAAINGHHGQVLGP